VKFIAGACESLLVGCISYSTFHHCATLAYGSVPCGYHRTDGVHVEIEGLAMILKGGEAAFDFLVASDKSQGCTKSLARRVGRSLGSEADEVVEVAYLKLDGHEVPRQYIDMQGVVQPDLLDGEAQDHELLIPNSDASTSVRCLPSDAAFVFQPFRSFHAAPTPKLASLVARTNSVICCGWLGIIRSGICWYP
jgi:hypothetical protein